LEGRISAVLELSPTLQLPAQWIEDQLQPLAERWSTGSGEKAAAIDLVRQLGSYSDDNGAEIRTAQSTP